MESDGEWFRGTKDSTDCHTVDNYFKHCSWGTFGEGNQECNAWLRNVLCFIYYSPFHIFVI